MFSSTRLTPPGPPGLPPRAPCRRPFGSGTGSHRPDRAGTRWWRHCIRGPGSGGPYCRSRGYRSLEYHPRYPGNDALKLVYVLGEVVEDGFGFPLSKSQDETSFSQKEIVIIPAPNYDRFTIFLNKSMMLAV